MEGSCQDRQPAKFSFRHRPKGSQVVYQFYREGSQKLARRLERLLSTSVQAWLREVRFGLRAGSFPDGYLFAFQERESCDLGYMHLEGHLVRAILQRLLGVDGPDAAYKELTLLQRGVLLGVVKGQLESLDLPAQVDFAKGQGPHPSPEAMHIAIRLRIGGVAGMLHLHLPPSMVGPRPSSPRLDEYSLTLTACLGEEELTLEEYLELECGDVVLLGSTKDPLPVYIGQRRWLRAKPGICGTRMGIQITDILHEGDRSCE
ncbi:MAG: hypothetical protein GX182_01635 [Firmicutes bacterium]|nr:hypothetical protein [Bacillota bacterium]